jgi:phosphatidylethanolamine/phosphatidyl-N-methylethanolamine N-methyltransferase
MPVETQMRRPVVYDSLAGHYDHAMRPLERFLFARLRPRLFQDLPPGARLLEIGAGTGANFQFYPATNIGAACELSREMIDRARMKQKPDGVSFVQCEAEQLPFADNSFDAAIASLVFCSVASQPEAFAELRRVVRPRGTIRLLEHVRPRGILGYVFDALNLITVPLFDDHFNRRTAREASRAGLQIEHIERRALGIVNLISCHVPCEAAKQNG